MKNGKKYILRIAVAMMCAAMAVSALPAAAFAENSTPGITQGETQSTSGDCGTEGHESDVQWSFDESTGTLTISGTGAMVNYNDSTDETSGTASGTYPWNNDTIKNGTTSIVIADGVTSVGSKAFIAWPNVTSVSIGKDVSEIGAGAFGQLTSCTGFIVASENTSFVAEGGVLYGTENGVKTKLCYYPCAKAGTSFEIPNTVTLLGYNALCKVTQLTSVTFEEGGTEELTLGYGCFAYDTGLTSITLPARTAKICGVAFGQCTNLKAYDCGSVQAYKALMTNECGRLADSTVTVNGKPHVDENDTGYSFVPVGNEAAITGYIGNDTELEIPSVVRDSSGEEYTVTEISLSAFQNGDGNRNITSVIIPESVKTIYSYAFCGGKDSSVVTDTLKYIKIKSDTITIGQHAFSRNSDLTVDMSDVTTVNIQADSYRTHFGRDKAILVNNESIAKQLSSAIGTNTRIYVAPQTAYSPYWYAEGTAPDFTSKYSGDYTLTLNYNDNSTEDKVVKVIPNGVYPFSEEPDPSRPGYTFDGWYNGNTVMGKSDISMIDDLTLTAHWTANAYTIKFDANGGTGTIEDQNATYDADVTLPANSFTNEGKVFAGWATEPNGQAVYADQEKVKNLAESGTVTLYAVWAVKSTPITPATPVTPVTPTPSEPIYTPSVSNGWRDLSQGTVYYKNGVKVKGWQTIDGETYYFDQKGILQTGWLKLDDHWYRLDSTGALQTGWVKVGNAWYFMEENGVMKSATWFNDGGKWYYLGADGAMYANKWRCTKGVWYYLLGNGEMAKNRWVEDKGNWYYLGADGGMLVDTTTPDGYRVDENGVWIKK